MTRAVMSKRWLTKYDALGGMDIDGAAVLVQTNFASSIEVQSESWLLALDLIEKCKYVE